VTGLGLLPLAIGSGTAGREIEGPMAIIILGGLFTSTALNLLVLPTLALRYGRFGKPTTVSTSHCLRHLVGADALGRGEGELLNLMMRRILHRFFELGIIVKGVDGGLELVGGLLLVFLPPAAINRVVFFFVEGESAATKAIAMAIHIGGLSGSGRLGPAHYIPDSGSNLTTARRKSVAGLKTPLARLGRASPPTRFRSFRTLWPCQRLVQSE
jgi:hypothetical protein